MKNLFWMGFVTVILLICVSSPVTAAQDFLPAKDRLMKELSECDEKAQMDPAAGGLNGFAEWSQCYWEKKLDFFSKDPESAPFMDIFRHWASSERLVWEKVDREEIKLESAKEIISSLEKIYEEALYERFEELKGAERASWDMRTLARYTPDVLMP